jgi:uncharacterized protein YcbK (DUF882 family)
MEVRINFHAGCYLIIGDDLLPHFVLIRRICFSIIFAFLIFPELLAAEEPKFSRFFLMGSGSMHIINGHDQRELNVSIINTDGSFNEDALKKVDALFNFPTEEKGEHISLRMLFMLSYFSNTLAPGKTIYMYSGYRSPEYNEKLKQAGGYVARTSTHIDGMAVDFSLDGLDCKTLWESIRRMNCCGAGHYPGEMVHLDAARPRSWEATKPKGKPKRPEHNRSIYISSEYDRYRPGEKMRLSFSSVSDFGFGVRKKVSLVTDRQGRQTSRRISLTSEDKKGCLYIKDRKDSRFIYASLPEKIKPGRYRIKIDFCNKPFPTMPSRVVSNEFEIVAGASGGYSDRQ